jgi:branched-subunit amino acid aminotransferase/4-amino-4-deoxychorismate lyase
VELVAAREGSPELRVRVRPAPALSREAVAWTMSVPDPRQSPRDKGPDLALLETWRARARKLGADEAMLVDRDGRLLEGAFSSLLWWEDDGLCAVPDEAPILPGVTRGLLLDLARARGTRVEYRRPRPHDLGGRETWLVSALHGIRRVSGWIGAERPAGDAGRAPAWRPLLDSTAVPVPTAPAEIAAT